MMASNEGHSLGTESLRLFFFGPGFGEAIVVQLPDGQWGLVDYCSKGKEDGDGILKFLNQRNVERLAFFCLTHPHEDHYFGTDRLLKEYRGKVDRIWRFSGISNREIAARAVVSAYTKAVRDGDPEARQLADNFCDVMAAIGEMGKDLSPDRYLRVVAPVLLFGEGAIRISALRASTAMIDFVETKIIERSSDSKNGFLIFNDDEGALLNSLSVVLLIEFGNAKIALLADAQGQNETFCSEADELCVVKIAHHGSANGLAAAALRKSPGFGVVTPYRRSHLPKEEMIQNYRALFKKMIVTSDRAIIRPKTPTPGLRDPRLMQTGTGWFAVEVFSDGKTRAFDEVGK